MLLHPFSVCTKASPSIPLWRSGEGNERSRGSGIWLAQQVGTPIGADCLLTSNCRPEATLLPAHTTIKGDAWWVVPSHWALKRGLKVRATLDLLTVAGELRSAFLYLWVEITIIICYIDPVINEDFGLWVMLSAEFILLPFLPNLGIKCSFCFADIDFLVWSCYKRIHLRISYSLRPYKGNILKYFLLLCNDVIMLQG